MASSIDKIDDVLLSDYEELQKAYHKLKEEFEMTLQQSVELMKQNIELIQKNKDLLQKNQQLHQTLADKKPTMHTTRTLENQNGESVITLNFLHDDTLQHIMKFVGKNCYIPFALISKRCYEIFWTNFLPKRTFSYGFAPMHVIKGRPFNGSRIAEAVVCYNRFDILSWFLELDGKHHNKKILYTICARAIVHGRLNFLRCFFQSAPRESIEYLKRDYPALLCGYAIIYRQLEILRWLREEEGCAWDGFCRLEAEKRGFNEILRYLDENNCPQYGAREIEIDRECEVEAERHR